MKSDAVRSLRSVLAKITAEQHELEGQRTAIEGALLAVNGRARSGRTTMKLSSRRAISRRMKAYWAKRKKT